MTIPKGARELVSHFHKTTPEGGLWWTSSIVRTGTISARILNEWGEDGEPGEFLIGGEMLLGVAKETVDKNNKARVSNGYEGTFQGTFRTRNERGSSKGSRTVVSKNHIWVESSSVKGTTMFSNGTSEILTEVELVGRDWWQVKVERKGKVLGFEMTAVGPAVDLRAAVALKEFGREASRASETMREFSEAVEELASELSEEVREDEEKRENLSERERLLPDFDDWKGRLREL